MRGKTTLWLLVAVLLVGAFTWYAERNMVTRKQQLEQEQMAFRTQSETLVYIRFEQGERVIECEKQEEQWYIRRPVDARADAGEIDRLVTQLVELPRGETVTPQDMRKRSLTEADFGMGRPRARLTLEDHRGRFTYRVGRDTPLGTMLYFMREGGEPILTAPVELLEVFPDNVGSLRDRVLIHGDSMEVVRLDVRRGSGFLQLERGEGGAWNIQQPVVGRADQARVLQMAEAALGLRVEEFIADGVSDTAAYGLDPEGLHISVWLKDSENPRTVYLGNVSEKDEGLRYAALENEDSVVVVKNESLQPLLVEVDSVRDRRLLSLDAAEIVGVEIVRGESAVELEKSTEGQWAVVRPQQWPADASAVDLIIHGWKNVSAGVFIDAVGTNEVPVEFRETARKITFKRGLAEDPEKTPVSLLVSGEQTTNGLNVVKVEPENWWCGVRQNLVQFLPLNPLYFRHKEVLTLKSEDIRKITMTRGEREWSVEKGDEGRFAAPEGVSAQVDSRVVLALLSAVESLKARAFLYSESIDPVELGLDPPEATVTFELAGEVGISKTVLLGKPAVNQSVYAAIRGLDLNFILSEADAVVLTQPLYIPEASPVETTDDQQK